MSHNSDGAFLSEAVRPVNVRDSILPAQSGQQSLLPSFMTGSQRKTAYALRQNCEAMICGNARRHLTTFTYGDGKTVKAFVSAKPENLHCTGFLTLTVGDVVEGKFQQIWDAKEASRRINNLNRRVLPDLFEKAIVVTERHKNGAIHFHVLGILRGRPDIRAGFNFDEVKRRRYGSVSAELSAIWKRLRTRQSGGDGVLEDYGFGRAELTPVRSTGEAVACYISKYIEKNVCNRLPEDKRKKLVRYIGFEKTQLKPNQFSWGTPRAAAWRAKTRECAGLIGCETREQAAEALGPRWAFHISGIWRKVSDAAVPWMEWSYRTRYLICDELQRKAGAGWCRAMEREKTYVVLGEIYTATEYRDAGFSGSQLRPEAVSRN